VDKIIKQASVLENADEVRDEQHRNEEMRKKNYNPDADFYNQKYWIVLAFDIDTRFWWRVSLWIPWFKMLVDNVWNEDTEQFQELSIPTMYTHINWNTVEA